jgi:hypothetical protein
MIERTMMDTLTGQTQIADQKSCRDADGGREMSTDDIYDVHLREGNL